MNHVLKSHAKEERNIKTKVWYKYIKIAVRRKVKSASTNKEPLI
jgi:hypothetical protein